MVDFLKKLPHGGNPSSKRIAVRVNNKALPFLRQGHPWLFEDSIEKISTEGQCGDVAVLFDKQGKNVLGAGLYDPLSSVRIKVLAHGASNPPVGAELFAFLAEKAAELRAPHLCTETTAWRLVNGDSDSFSGMAADKYHDTLVLKFYSAALLPWVGDIAKVFFEHDSSLKKLSIRLSRELQKLPESQRHELEDGTLFHDDTEAWDGKVQFHENGLLFEADVKHGQKTGFFLDQRENRAKVGKLAAGCRSVLNFFSYSGGFSLYAARGGAEEVYSVDLNKHAIAN